MLIYKGGAKNPKNPALTSRKLEGGIMDSRF
jgi:hypothetical protein